eukprot:CAMPEP_0170578644 /NCGR_PEP_ID=MMETSP0224-20130122/5565_1 /TAXON_ID=285029 /ORGANISM="Togula jolla, Strain CCCM 725" /LENGTH=890 /DNA_ID=CAMNT_0010901625 /DNA_START=53 /DNA_END=2725 /DNA_ORIENTATION=-
MSSPRGNGMQPEDGGDEPPRQYGGPAEEDPLSEGGEDNEEDEGEGEDLFGANMAEDYQEDPALDQYDPEMLDDSTHAALTIEQRRAAEQEMEARDQGGRWRPDPSSPGLLRLTSDSEIGSPHPGAPRAKRLRTGLEQESEHMDFPDDLNDEDVPPSAYDLNNEKLGDDMRLEKRLEQKIKKCFQQFLYKFVPEGQNYPKYPEELRKMAEDHNMHLDVHFSHLQQWSAQLSLWISEHPLRMLPILNETLMTEAARKFETYRHPVLPKDENELRVAVHSFPIVEPIRELCTKHLNKLVMVHGVVTKRSGVFNEVKRLYLRCAKCGFPSGPFDVAQEKDLKPGSCVECQSKGPWRVDRQETLYRNHQKITLQESPSSVEPGKMPRSKQVILTGDQVDKVRPGDELQLTGIYRCLYDAATNARTCFPVYRTEIESVHAKRKGDVKSAEITDDQHQQILELAKCPNIRERFIASIAPSIYGMWHVKTAIALSILGGERKIAAGKHRIRGDINTLIVGDPGLAKSQFLKYIEQTAPRAVYTTGKGASAVGLTAAVTRDEHGQWCLEGGAMVLADDGICLIDEFDKMNDQDRTSLHEAMEQQTISISKAGIVASLQARCAVVAVANPTEGRYDPQRTFAQNVNLSDPILSRFDMLCVLRDESDAVQDERLADHVVCSHIRSHPEATGEARNIRPKLEQKASHVQPIDQDLLRSYIVYARQKVHPKIQDIDKEKLANFYKDIRAEAFSSGGAPMTARHIESIIRLAEAHAKIELRQHVTSRDLDNAIGVMLESFIQSQKHQVSEELRKKFRRYIAQATPLADQFALLLEKLFKDRTERIRLSRAVYDGDLSQVAVKMSDVVQQIEQNDIDLDEAHSFMRTARFSNNYRVEGENIYRIV